MGFVPGGKMLDGMVNDYKQKMNRHQSNMFLLSDWLDFLYGGLLQITFVRTISAKLWSMETALLAQN